MLKPLGDRVVLKAEEEEKTVGGIVLASNAKDKPTTGKVVAVGEGRTLDNGQHVAVSVKEGDKVLFDKYAGKLNTTGKSTWSFTKKTWWP